MLRDTAILSLAICEIDVSIGSASIDLFRCEAHFRMIVPRAATLISRINYAPLSLTGLTYCDFLHNYLQVVQCDLTACSHLPGLASGPSMTQAGRKAGGKGQVAGWASRQTLRLSSILIMEH